LPSLREIDDALAPGAPQIHAHREENVLVRGRVVRGDVDRALDEAEVTAEAEYETGFVEHAYIEPEAGFARRVGDRVEIQACTQSPYMDRADIATILGIAPECVRIIPTAVGGGFGSKLDLSVQPFLALAAWRLNKPVRMTYSRTESIIATTKRHPARMRLRAGCNRDGKLLALDFSADFNTGAYSSWDDRRRSGPGTRLRSLLCPALPRLDAGRPYQSGAGGSISRLRVPQAAIAQEQLYDDLADKVGMDRLEFRILNALDNNLPTVTGQVMEWASAFRLSRSAAPKMAGRAPAIGGVQFQLQRSFASRSRYSWNVVRVRQHVSAESINRPHRPETRRPDRPPSRRGRHRPGLEHHRHSNLRGRSRRANRPLRPRVRRHRHHSRLRQDLGFPSDLRDRQSRAHGRNPAAKRHHRVSKGL